MNSINFPEQKIIYKRRTGSYGEANKQLMEEFKQWLKNRQLLDKEAVVLGIPQDDPRQTAPEQCRYDVALVVDSFDDYSEIKQAILPAGKYAVFTIVHTAEAMKETFAKMNDVLIRAGYVIDSERPLIERYAVDLINQNKCQLCVPITKK
ncbi:GyrI-like domain-containing protein [Enterococcus sp. UD-01]|jgi:DNA gyrase inhibitor GyrI|uniref:AraC family transcriptional regulator n=1 Tax=Enterococcus sp. UD-01 TaxID=3373911 RepID=UPI003833C067